MSPSTLSDSDIRPALRAELRRQHGDDPDTIFLEELGLCRGSVRVDLVAVNGIFHGYEIKSDRDSLRRLQGQAELYSKVLERATLVVGARHFDEALKLIPSWWGVLCIEPHESGPQFWTVREAEPNPTQDPRALVELLWLEDALDLLSQRGIARGFRGKTRPIIWDHVCNNLDLIEIRDAVRQSLKARPDRVVR